MYYCFVTTAAVAPDAFRAVSDPTRRALLDLLAGAERSVSELVAHFAMTQPAISQHLRILVAAGLATVRKAGRQRLYRVNAEPLRAVYDWAAHYERFWDDHLDRLGQYLDKEPRT
jgi:DNA-binding transcriptional ArsR family regulator